jgi:hypothetical protein
MIASTKEVVIETRTRGRARSTVIWVAVDDGIVYVRSVRGCSGRWYQRVLVDPEVVLVVGGTRIPTRAVAAPDPDSVARASEAFRRKYPRGGSLNAMLRPAVLDTTLRLDPRS